MKQKIDIDKFDGLRKRIAKERQNQKTCITICSGTGCHAYGCVKVAQAFVREIEKKNLQDSVEVKTTGCHGFCERGPIVVIQPQGIFYQRIQIKHIKEVISRTIMKNELVDELLYVDPRTQETIVYERDVPFYKKQKRVILSKNGLIDPREIKDYIAVNGYSALAKVLDKVLPQGVINEIKSAGLRGRGGAGFPTGLKWERTSRSRGDTKYVVCNCDEGDPGAYMDRSLLEGNPHSVIEGMLIGAYAIGAKEGYIYVRDEYPIAVENISLGIEQAREYNLLGKNILGSGFHFDLIVSKGAGAFVSGEESALLASIEGRIGVPSQRPPFPAQRGLWGKPTNINNVETWANVPIIIEKGASWYSNIGTDGSKGTKIFSLVGKINNTGLVEVPMGMTLREIIFDIGGGIPEGKEFKAVQTGGPSGGCIPKELVDLPIDYESLAKVGSMMGSGGMIVMDENTCLVDIAKYFLNFLRDESCGKCVSCREGTQRMWEIVKDITDGKGTLEGLALLEELARSVKDASLCGLGQTAANPVLSTLRYFRSEYEAHILQKKCPALVCKEIVSSPCHYICPIGQEASTYIALVAQKRFEEAYHIIRKDNPLPSVCGRVCSRACETVCRAGEIGEPISIRGLKRFVMDWAKAKGLDSPVKFAITKSAKVAIIGAGPAGLTAGYYLAKKGYQVRIFEALPVPGGMLAVTIPEHRLPKDILSEDIDYLVKSGVSIKTHMALGKDFTLDDLHSQGYKAVFIATGAHKPIEIGVPGEEAEGVLQALEFLKDVHLKRPVELGAKVVVIGGGNSAVDAARVALRNKNVKKITILYRRTRKEMPAYPEEVEAALEEGVKIEFLVAPTWVRTKDGRVTGVQCRRMKLGEKDESGRPKPVPIEGSEFLVDVDTLILALSERAYTPYLKDSDGLSLSPKWGTIIVDPATMATTRPGVFAGGDVVTGPSSVVEAIAAGKAAAEAIDNYLEGRPLVRARQLTRPSLYVEPVVLKEDELQQAKRSKMRHLPPSKRKTIHEEIELGFTRDIAVREARRCLRCDLETEDGKKAVGRET